MGKEELRKISVEVENVLLKIRGVKGPTKETVGEIWARWERFGEGGKDLTGEMIESLKVFPDPEKRIMEVVASHERLRKDIATICPVLLIYNGIIPIEDYMEDE